MGADASTAPLGSSKPKKQVPIFHQMLIVLHGSRKSGKTSLLRRMNGLNFQPQYTPTKCLQASEIIWHPICMPNEAIKIIVWDVVDKAIDPTPQAQRTKQLPDASNVDTFSRADGIIVVYDPRDEESVKYARSILDQAPQSKPSLIVMNFADSFETAPSVPSLMEPYTNSYFHLTASMKTNQGLAELANWLDLPMNVSLSKIYELHLKQAEENLTNLKKEFNLTGLDEESTEQSSKSTNKGNSKDFWDEPNENKNDDFGLGTGEVSADFFMDDDETDLKTRQNLEKLKKQLNIIEKEEEEEDIDEEMKIKMAKKKSKILSKTSSGNINQSKTTLKPTQNQNQDENEYSDNEDNNNDNNPPRPQSPALANISFDIPVVAENDNNFFEDDNTDDKKDKELETDDVDDKLIELKKKLNLEIPKEEEEEEKEEKPKPKKSKILPKVKPPQIIIKPAQPQQKVQPQEKTEIEQSSIPKQENAKLDNLENTNTSKIESQNIEIPNVSNEKESFFSDESDNTNITQAKNDISFENENNEDKFETGDITFPSFGDENENKKNDNENITFPSFGDEEAPQSKNDISLPSFENENKEDKFETGNITFPSFDDKNEDKKSTEENATFSSFDNENNNETVVQNEIINQNQDENKNILNENDQFLNTDSKSTTNTNTNNLENISFPSFGNDDFFPANENKNEKEVSAAKLPTLSDITFPSFGNDDFFDDDDSKNDDQIKTENINNEEEEQKIEKKSKILPQKDIHVSQNKVDTDKVEQKLEPAITTETTQQPESISNINIDQKLPEITLSSFGNDSNFFSDNDKTEKETPNEQNANFPSIDINIDDNNKGSNFFSDDENTTENAQLEVVKNANDDHSNEDIQKKKKSIILPKQNLHTINDSTKIVTKDIDQSDLDSQSQIPMPMTTIPDIQENTENNDSFFTEQPSNSSNIPAVTDMPAPPPIDFSNSFLSEKQIPTTTTAATVNTSTTNTSSFQQNTDSDLDIINAIRRQEAEKAEKARQNQALLMERAASIPATESTTTTTAEDNQKSNLETQAPSSAISSSYSPMGDYEAFDDTPQTSTTKERRHRKHGSSSHKSRRHKSGRKGKTEESDGQNEDGGTGAENDESYLSFD